MSSFLSHSYLLLRLSFSLFSSADGTGVAVPDLWLLDSALDRDPERDRDLDRDLDRDRDLGDRDRDLGDCDRDLGCLGLCDLLSAAAAVALSAAVTVPPAAEAGLSVRALFATLSVSFCDERFVSVELSSNVISDLIPSAEHVLREALSEKVVFGDHSYMTSAKFQNFGPPFPLPAFSN